MTVVLNFCSVASLDICNSSRPIDVIDLATHLHGNKPVSGPDPNIPYKEFMMILTARWSESAIDSSSLLFASLAAFICFFSLARVSNKYEMISLVRLTKWVAKYDHSPGPLTTLRMVGRIACHASCGFVNRGSCSRFHTVRKSYSPRCWTGVWSHSVFGTFVSHGSNTSAMVSSPMCVDEHKL